MPHTTCYLLARGGGSVSAAALFLLATQEVGSRVLSQWPAGISTIPNQCEGVHPFRDRTPRGRTQINIYNSDQFTSYKGKIGKEGEWDGWNYGIDAPNSNTPPQSSHSPSADARDMQREVKTRPRKRSSDQIDAMSRSCEESKANHAQE